MQIYLNEKISKSQLNDVEKFADKLFSKLNIDIVFTKHFFERLNDKRNKKEINTSELIRLFRELYKQHKDKFIKSEIGKEKVITDIISNLNLPFTLKIDTKENEIDFISKTIMRKDGFKTTNPRIIIK